MLTFDNLDWQLRGRYSFHLLLLIIDCFICRQTNLAYPFFYLWSERFKVLSYNILADYLALDHRNKLYFHIPPYILDWQWRKRSILFELGLWSADILCLQVCAYVTYSNVYSSLNVLLQHIFYHIMFYILACGIIMI